jgi:hypothetical protein
MAREFEKETTCTLCGSAVIHYSSDEGTQGYLPKERWQPIKTAPRNEMLMLRMPDEEYWWGKFISLDEIGLGGYWKVSGWRKHTSPQPTHWRHLPAQPEISDAN